MSDASKIDLYDAMSSLRAVRRLRPDPIAPEVLERVLLAASWAPTGGNVQPWRVLAVDDAQKKTTMAEYYAQQWQIYTRNMRSEAPSLPPSKQQKTLAAGDYLAEHMAQTPVILVFCFKPSIMAITDSELDRPSVVGGGSVYPAVQNTLLACRAEGLGCVLTTLLCFKEPEVKSLLNIPDDWGTCAHIPIGYPVLGGHGPIRRKPLDKLVYNNSWGNSYNT